MPLEICRICTTRPAVEYGVCATCKPISRICSTSAEDGVKYGIPGTSLENLLLARTYERQHTKRSTILKALDRAIKKLDRGPDMANKEGCKYSSHLSADYAAPQFPKPLGQCCTAGVCKIECGRKS